MKAYNEEDFLPLSALQHFAFCPRQFALIHMEQQWAENFRTMDGHLMHERAHDTGLTEKRGDLLISRGMAVRSRALGVTGACDVVEFRQAPDGVPLHGRGGFWQPVPVEYKRGKPRDGDEADAIQLCAQALCLEEMLGCSIPQAYLYYGEPARRMAVPIDTDLRERVGVLMEQMHDCYARRRTPRPRPAARCRACSLANLCLPKLARTPSAREYLLSRLREEETV